MGLVGTTEIFHLIILNTTSGLVGAAGPTERSCRAAPLGAANHSAAGSGGAGVPPLPGVPHLQQALRVSQAPGGHPLQDRAQQRPAAEQRKSFLGYSFKYDVCSCSQCWGSG